jgi:Domain of unknown function (DUF4386)
MKNYNGEITIRSASMIAGVGYLLAILSGLAVNFYSFQKLIIPADIVATTHNINVDSALFRYGIAGWLFVLICDTVVAWGLYVFFRPVSRSISLLAAWFRILFVAIFGTALINTISVLQLLREPAFAGAYAINQLQSLVMLHINNYNFGYHFGLVFFGIHIFLLGYLMFRAGYMPKLIGALLIIASAAYLVDSFGSILSPKNPVQENFSLMIASIPAMVAEISLALWLLFRGAYHFQ